MTGYGGALDPADREIDDLMKEVRFCLPQKAALREQTGEHPDAREQLSLLFDSGSVNDIGRPVGPIPGGMVVGWGTVHNRVVLAGTLDLDVPADSARSVRMHNVMDLAARVGAPLVTLVIGSGVSADSVSDHSGILSRYAGNSGVVPQISVLTGTRGTWADYTAALTDFVFVIRPNGQVRPATLTDELADFTYASVRSCMKDLRYLLSLLPASSGDLPPEDEGTDPRHRSTDELRRLTAVEPGRAYDVREVVNEIVDDADCFEVGAARDTAIMCILARLGGKVVGVVAGQPSSSPAAPSSGSWEKAARFIQTCDAFNIPLLTIVDSSAALPDVSGANGESVRSRAKLLYAYGSATVPRIRLAIPGPDGMPVGTGECEFNGADLTVTWPSSDGTSHRPVSPCCGPRGGAGEVIEPRRTRSVLIEALSMLAHKQDERLARKHGIAPM